MKTLAFEKGDHLNRLEFVIKLTQECLSLAMMVPKPGKASRAIDLPWLENPGPWLSFLTSGWDTRVLISNQS